MRLPEELENDFTRELERYEEERHMPYITSIERFAEARGSHLARVEMLLVTLEARFGKVPRKVALAIRAVDDDDRLISLHRQASVLSSLNEFAQLLANPTTAGRNRRQ